MRGQHGQIQSRRQKAHRTVNSDCLVHHRTVQRPHLSELQRSNPNGWVTWLAHRTVRCARRQHSSPTTILVVGAINTPQPPLFKASKHSLLLIQYKSNTQHSKIQIKATDRIKVHNSTLVFRTCEKINLCSFVVLVAWLAFLFLSFLLSKPCKRLQNPNGWMTWLVHRIVSGGGPDCPGGPSTGVTPNGCLVVEGYKYPPTSTPTIEAFITLHSIQEQSATLQDTNQSL